MSTPSGPRDPRISDIAAARITAGLGLLFALLTLVSHRPDVLMAATSTGLALLAAVMLLHRGSVTERSD